MEEPSKEVVQILEKKGRLALFQHQLNTLGYRIPNVMKLPSMFVDWYSTKYFKNSSAKPLFHVYVIVGVIGFALQPSKEHSHATPTYLAEDAPLQIRIPELATIGYEAEKGFQTKKDSHSKGHH